jgi:hypothetical protein
MLFGEGQKNGDWMEADWMLEYEVETSVKGLNRSHEYWEKLRIIHWE